MGEPLPWDVVETLPSSDPDLVATWSAAVAVAVGTEDRVRSLVGRSLSSYWAVQEGVTDRSWAEVTAQRHADTDEALRLARAAGTPDLVAIALLGSSYARWGPDHAEVRQQFRADLAQLRPTISDPDLELRARELDVVACLDMGDLEGARRAAAEYAVAAGPGHRFARRRVELWAANLAMTDGQIEEAVALNQQAVAATANEAGSPFSFQNVAITLAIERFFHRGLDDLIDAIRSIRASSDRVGANWDTGLAFALAEAGQLDEARDLFERVAPDGFARVHRDLNWLVTMVLLGLVAVRLDDRSRAADLAERLAPWADRDAIHGAGYASYGPVGRVVGQLLAHSGQAEAGRATLDRVLATRPAGPWTALARLDRAIAGRTEDPRQARQDAETAVRALRDLGMDAWAAEADALRTALDQDGFGPPTCAWVEGAWHLQHPAGHAVLAAGVGMDALVHLLARPGEAIEVTTLDTRIDPALPTTAPATEHLDVVARAAYRRRLDQLASAERQLTPAEAGEADALRRELAQDRYRPSSSPQLERARVRVTKALRRTLDAVAERDAGLGRHLADSLETGRRCCYGPPDGLAWRIVYPPERPTHS